MKDINGRTLKVNHLVAVFGAYKGKLFKVTGLTSDYRVELECISVLGLNIERYCSQVRKLEVEELI